MTEGSKENTNESTNKNRKIFKNIMYGIFLIYIVFLLKIVLFKYCSIADVLNLKSDSGFRSLNVIPFQTIKDFINLGSENFLWAFSNILGNIAIFMPLGYLLPLLFKKLNNIYKVLSISLCLSVTFEILQYTLYLGSADIDDIILNTLGGVIGYGVYILIKKFINKEVKIQQVSILLSSIAFVVGFSIAKEQFGNILGLTKHETISMADEGIPNTDPNLSGTYLSIKDDSLKMYNSPTYKSSQNNDLLNTSIFKITDDTKFYYRNFEEEKNKTTIKYNPLNKNDISKIEEFSLISVWKNKSDDIDASVIVFSDKMSEGSGIMHTTTGDSNENEITDLNGYVEEIKENSVVINLITVQEMEDGSSISTSGNGKYGTYINVGFDPHATYTLNIIENGGADVTTKKATFNDIGIGCSLDMKVKK
ncbi:MAG: VanZ family protein [Romboutsia sp.]|uniref:VanZ family protein n=1 Tax=Romboutsia sp. TaxID=1965302 RepID=UPI003F354291